MAKQIETDLAKNSPDIMVSFVDNRTLDHSEIGGVGNLEMIITPHFVISIVYDDNETTKEQIDSSIEWMLANDY